jgi:hypothetical protein
MDSPIFDSTFGTGRFKDEKFTDPPRSDVSAGLIEAEVMKTAELYAGRLHACLLGAGFEPPRQQWLAAHFRDAITSYFRTRATDRNPDVSAGLIEAAEIERQACRESHFHRAEAFNEAARIIRARAADRSAK